MDPHAVKGSDPNCLERSGSLEFEGPGKGCLQCFAHQNRGCLDRRCPSRPTPSRIVPWSASVRLTLDDLWFLEPAENSLTGLTGLEFHRSYRRSAS